MGTSESTTAKVAQEKNSAEQIAQGNAKFYKNYNQD
jgi:hypothetical protein